MPTSERIPGHVFAETYGGGIPLKSDGSSSQVVQRVGAGALSMSWTVGRANLVAKPVHLGSSAGYNTFHNVAAVVAQNDSPAE